MADRYWVGGTGTWNTSSTTNWSASSGGASGASVPTVADNVFFDQAGTYTVTMTGALACLDITVSSGTVTFAAGTIPTLNVRGSMSLLAGTIWSSTGTTNFTATTTGKTITTNGTTINGAIALNGSGGGWILGSALTISGAILDLSLGSFNTGNYSLNVLQIAAFNPTARTLDFGSSTITLTSSSSSALGLSATSGLTFNAGTSQINLTNSTGGISSGGLTFYNVAFTSTTSGTRPITGINTFNNLAVTAPSSAGITNVTFAANQTINGTLSTTGTAGNKRVFFASATYGLGRTLTVNSAPSLTDADFRDLYVKGTAAPISGTRIGNRGNCSGITFSTPKTVYWATLAGGNISGNNWAATSGGAVSIDNFPLPQDTATFVNTGLNTSATITFDSTVGFIGSVDFSARTNLVTIDLNSLVCYGNLTLGSGWTLSGSSGTLTFSGDGTKTITSAGKTYTQAITVDTYGGTVQLADALNNGTGQTLTVTNGTFTTAGFAVTAGSLSSSANNVRTINLGASTLTLSSTSPVNFTTSTNLTFNAGTSTINSSITVGGNTSTNLGSLTYYNVSFTNGSTFSRTILGQNTFNNLTIAGSGLGVYMQSVLFGGNQTINGTLTCSGLGAVRRVFLQSDGNTYQRTLTVAAISATDCDFRDIILAGAAAGASPTRAGDCGGNTGITFPASKTVYWNLAGTQNWSATAWCTASGGTPDINQFPLAQDTAVFDNTGSVGTVSINLAWNIGTFDASLRTSAMTLSTSFSFPCIYGDWKFGTGVTSSSATGTIQFSKTGTQTITSNGVQFGCPIGTSHGSANVQLADALSLSSIRTLSVGQGTFDAVSYNVTVGLFFQSSSTNAVKMGSGTWTISGAGTVWTVSAPSTVTVGTSTIVLSDTSTTARTFAGGNLYCNKLTIGGATGTSTLTITGANAFGELASTKTVAHTIIFQSSAIHYIGKWSVTGTVSNVVTISPSIAATTYTINIFGPANTGIDYLSVSYCTVSTTSPGEFYVGVNSTNTAGNTRVIFTATPAPRTLYWVGGTGNWSSTTKWSTSSGGASGAAIPMSLDTVTFDSLSNATAYTATIDAGVTLARCAAFTMAGPLTGNVTFAGIVPIAYHGNVSFAATGITRTYTGTMNWAGNASYTFTTNGVVLNSQMAINGIGSTWTLGSALNTFPSFTVNYGSFSTSASNYALAAGSLSSNNSNVRSILLNGSTLTGGGGSIFFGTTAPNLTFNAGTSTINHGGSGFGFNGGGQTFYNVSITTTGATATVFTGSNTFNNLTFPSVASITIGVVQFSANQTINGTLTLTAGTAAAYRTFLASDTIGTTRTLTVNALAAGAADIDFRDITIAGTAAPLTGTRFGDAKGNSGITFPAAKTVYYRQTGSNNWATSGAGSWSLTSGGAFDATAFPLAQDTAVFPAATYPASGSTTTINANYNIGTIDMSLRTSNTMALSIATSPFIYGNFVNGTGATLPGIGVIAFAGRTTQAITSAGATFTQTIIINTPSGSVGLQDSFSANSSVSGVLTLTQGAFNANIYNVSLIGVNSTFASNNTNIRTIGIGSGTWTIAGPSNAWVTASTNLTVTGTGTISLTNASAKTFIGAGVSYSGITLNQGGLGTLTISGNNTFANITKTAVGATTISLGASTQRVGAFTATGTVGNLLTITGTSTASIATLIYTGGGVISTVDYIVPTFVRAYPTTSTWFAGANSTNGGSLGWIFTASGGVVYAVFITESATALDSISAAFGSTTYLSNIAESNTASDTIAAAAIFRSAVSDTANASDAAAAAMLFASSFSDTANATDSISSKATFGSLVSDTVNATDSIAAQEIFGSSISESVTAVDSISAQEILYPAISETVGASETNAASAAFLSTVSDTATATDSVSSNAAFSSAISDTVNVSDSPSPKAVFGSSVSDTVTVTDTPSAAQGFGTSVSEQANASETNAAAQGFSTTIAEQANASETNSAAQGFGSNISEQVNANDSISAMAMFAGYLNESATASESNSAKAVFGSNVSDSVTVSDSVSSKATFRSNVADTAQALDSISAAATFKPIVSESARGQATDSVAASTFNASAADNMQASNTFSGQASFGAAVSNTVNAADSDVGFISFPTSVSESATALDSISAAQRFRTAIMESSQASNIFSAIEVFKSNIAETARTLETSAASAEFDSAVSDTARANDATSSKATFGSAVNNTVQVSDSNVGFINFPGSIAESVQVSDQDLAQASFATQVSEAARVQDVNAVAASTFNAVTTDTARALDSASSSQAFGSNVANTVRVSESPSAQASFGGVVSETATALDASSSNAAFGSQVSNSVQVSDAPSAAASFGANFSATVQVQDAAASIQGFGSSIAETAQASATNASSQGFGVVISESATANDTVLARAIFQGIISEAAQGSDQFSTTAVFLAAFSEFAQAYAEDVGYLTGSRAISESSTVFDSASAAGALRGYISESATGADSIAAKFFHATFINESAQGLDSVDAPGSIYNVITSEQAAVNALPSTNAIFYAAVLAYAGITDVAYARYLWELIDDSQTPDWSSINDTQSAGWVEINDIQASNWQNVGNTQSSGWTEINDTQNPGWERITP